MIVLKDVPILVMSTLISNIYSIENMNVVNTLRWTSYPSINSKFCRQKSSIVQVVMNNQRQ